MTHATMAHRTSTLERTYGASPARVFRAPYRVVDLLHHSSPDLFRAVSFAFEGAAA